MLPCPLCLPPYAQQNSAPPPVPPLGTTSSGIMLSLGLYLSSLLHYLPLMASRVWGGERVRGDLFKRFLESMPVHRLLP